MSLLDTPDKAALIGIIRANSPTEAARIINEQFEWETYVYGDGEWKPSGKTEAMKLTASQVQRLRASLPRLGRPYMYDGEVLDEEGRLIGPFREEIGRLAKKFGQTKAIRQLNEQYVWSVQVYDYELGDWVETDETYPMKANWKTVVEICKGLGVKPKKYKHPGRPERFSSQQQKHIGSLLRKYGRKKTTAILQAGRGRGRRELSKLRNKTLFPHAITISYPTLVKYDPVPRRKAA